MKIEFIKTCQVVTARYKAGEVVELDDATANQLIDAGKAIPQFVEVKQEDRSIGLSEDKPKTRAKAKK
tara:strand:- start:2170 stop:2373 length:204 start_codon:yes stop_codon:yes gene_type:complete